MRIVATGAVSALGQGAAALDPFAPAAIRTDEELARQGLRKPRIARATPGGLAGDPAEWLLETALRQVCTNLDEIRPAWRTERLVLVVGTSSGGMWSQTRAFDALAQNQACAELCRAAPYWGPLNVLRRGFPAAPVIQVLAACASSAVALGLARELLTDGLADLVIAGGYDAVTPFVAAGFEALGVTTADRPLPFSLQRDGLALGEGAGLLALARDPGPGPWLTGFAASADASHPTSPSESGDALSRAISNALKQAQTASHSVLLSAHATATSANDRAEAKVIAGIGDQVEAVHAFKTLIGHTLGAGSVLELMSALRCLEQGSCPALEGAPHEPALRDVGQALELESRSVLKLASAFGGANAVLVAELDRPPNPETMEPREVWLEECGRPCATPRIEELMQASALDPIHVRRLDALSALCCSALLDVLPTEVGSRGDARTAEVSRQQIGVVMGSVLGSMEHNAAYQARLRERGHGRADPRKFPATSPNLAPGMASILFGLGGPCASVGAGYGAPFEALLLAIELLRGGHAEQMLVVVGDDRGPAVDALLQCASAPAPAIGALAIRLSTQRQEGTLASVGGRSADILARLGTESGSGWPELNKAFVPSLSSPQPGWPTLSAWLKEQGLHGP
ncbi:MAG: beta-ketoacyl synthase N-terminal-like domain-containing protein [Polyangiaceae bacterium]